MNAAPKTALVTGGSDGLGRCVASQLAQRGYVLTIIGRDPVKLASAVQRLPGSNHTALALDLSTPEGTTASVATELVTLPYALVMMTRYPPC